MFYLFQDGDWTTVNPRLPRPKTTFPPSRQGYSSQFLSRRTVACFFPTNDPSERTWQRHKRVKVVKSRIDHLILLISYGMSHVSIMLHGKQSMVVKLWRFQAALQDKATTRPGTSPQILSWNVSWNVMTSWHRNSWNIWYKAIPCPESLSTLGPRGLLIGSPHESL